MVGQVYVKRSVWSKAIPTILLKFRDCMSPLFACDELLEQVLNVDNRLVLAGKDSTVTVVEDDLVRTINICSEIIPILDPTKIDEVQACIDSCYQCNMATLLYLSAGAGWGVEISRIGTHLNSQNTSRSSSIT